jgi:hypothetical protein
MPYTSSRVWWIGIVLMLLGEVCCPAPGLDSSSAARLPNSSANSRRLSGRKLCSIRFCACDAGSSDGCGNGHCKRCVLFDLSG